MGLTDKAVRRMLNEDSGVVRTRGKWNNASTNYNDWSPAKKKAYEEHVEIQLMRADEHEDDENFQ